MSDVFIEHGKNNSILHNQEKSFVEKFLLYNKTNGHCNFYLETCGVCALGTAIEGVGATYKEFMTDMHSNGGIRYADIMWSIINSNVTHHDKFIASRSPTYLADVVEKCTHNATAIAVKPRDKNEDFDVLITSLKSKKAVVKSMTFNHTYGHYVCFVGCNENNGILYYYDSWVGNRENRMQASRLKEMSFDDFNNTYYRKRHLIVVKKDTT